MRICPIHGGGPAVPEPDHCSVCGTPTINPQVVIDAFMDAMIDHNVAAHTVRNTALDLLADPDWCCLPPVNEAYR